MKTFKSFLLAVALLFGALSPAMAQGTSTTSTILSTALTDTTTPFVVLASGTGISQSTDSNQYYLYVDQELMKIQTPPSTLSLPSGTFSVIRGYGGTFATTHRSGSTVWFGQVGKWDPNTGNGYGVFLPFNTSDREPIGSCTSASIQYLPMISPRTGRVFNCENSHWVRDDGYYFVSPGACSTTVSANSTGTNGLTVAGGVAVIQADTSASGTNTHTYSCNLVPPSRLRDRGITVLSVDFIYGVQTTALGTQAATLASGTFNSTTVFTTAAYPTPAASETASSSPARADAGTLAITPAAASFNTGTTTAGQFFSQLFTPATPFDITADLTQYWFNVTLQCQATSATITQSPGLLVHYAYTVD